MKFVTNLFRGKPASLEEGQARYQPPNEYYVLHVDESRTKCGRFVQIVKVILCIELIILIGWLGCVSFSYFGIEQNIDCRVSEMGCEGSPFDYNDIEVNNNHASGNVGDTDDVAETPARNRRFIKKRFATSEPIPKPVTATCWNEEEENRVLLEERRARQEIFAERSGLGYEYEQRTQQVFLEGIEKALNATSTSEIRFADELMDETMVVPSIQYLVTNASLKLQKEGYELARDLFMEMHGLNHRGPEWEGWNQDDIARNLTGAIFYSRLNMTSQSIFDNFVRFGEAFNLRYEKPEKRASGNAPYGKFTNLGKEPEKLGVRHLRHTLDNFVRLYYKIQNPSTPGVCGSTAQTRTKRSIEKRFVTETPIRKSASLMCWSKEQDDVLLEERRARLETFHNKEVKDEEHGQFTQNYLEGLAAALNATQTTEIHFDEMLVDSTPILRFMNYLLMNSSLELHKEGYEIIRDMYLEMLELRAHSSEWEGYDEHRVNQNMSALGIPGNVKMNSESIFHGIVKFGIPFNLRYQELVNRDNGSEPDKPVFGKLTYVGDEPEKLGVRRLRHILDGFVKLYFKIQDPSTQMVCNLIVQPSAEGGESETLTRDQRSVEERSVTEDPVSESVTTKCWSEEEDKILEEERLERQASFAFRTNKKMMDQSYAKAYLEGIEAALNATSISEIHFNDSMREPLLLKYMETLCENSSLDIRKEGYEIIRDLNLELYELKNHSPEWDGYNMERIEENLTASDFSDDTNKDAIFNNVVTFSTSFNLRYKELGNRESGTDPNKPVFGKFTYLGEEPEKLGIRHLRHILDAFVKFYFKTQDPSSSCKGDTLTTAPAPEPTDAKCWNTEQDPVLLEERRERLEAYALWNERLESKMLFSKNYLDILGKALNASKASEIHFDDRWSRSSPVLSFIQDLAMNSSLEICKEALEIARDFWLEIDELQDHTSEWEGYDLKTILNNLTDTSKSDGSVPTLEMMFDGVKKFGRAFNLRYEENENGDNGDKTDKPVLGKFIYLGEEPEKLGVRHMRHIFDGCARLYFRVRHPSTWAVCNSTKPTRAKRAIEKRAVTTEPVPESITTKCWSEEQDKILEEERLERLAAFGLRTNKKVMDSSYTKAYVESIDAALNATSISEIHFEDNMRKPLVLTYIESLCENSSLDIRKEGYEITRDLHLELYEMNNHSPDWDGFDVEHVVKNLTASHSLSVNTTKEAMFNDIVRFGNVFNLRYDEVEKRESGADPNKPVFGKFTYLGEEPEKLGIRHLRHIFDAFVKFYFKTQEPSSVCKGGTTATGSVPEPTDAKCWNTEQDPAFLEERQERLEAYRLRNERQEAKMKFTKTYLDALGEALSASNASEIHFDDRWTRSAPILSLIQDLAMNSSLDLAKEGLEIARDLWLEIDELEDHTSEWEGYDLNTVLNNLTDTSDDSTPTLEIMFDDLKKFGRAFNLRYQEIENEDSEDKKDKPVLGKFTYLGEEPEKLGVRHMRHILDGFARFYFKIRHPSIAPVCNSTAQTRAKRSVKKRAVTADPVPQSITTKCWSEEQDKILEEERLERLAAFGLRTNKKVMDISYTKAYVEGIEAALNATSISEIHFEDNMRKPLVLTYIESLCENSSLDIRKEGYEITRDMHLELYELNNHGSDWDGFNVEHVVKNLTASHSLSVNTTKEAMFNDIVRFGNVFNLRYDELGKRESGADPNKPVFGKFTYLGEEPEMLGIRHLRHIFDAFVKFYFKTQEPSSVCKDGTTATGPVPKPTDAKCWNTEQDPALLEERQERLEAYRLRNERHESKMKFSKTYLDTLGEALSASDASEIHFDDHICRSAPLLSFIQDLAMNNSLELCKEGLEIARDLWLEIDALEDHTSEWEGYDLKTIQKNLTDTSDDPAPTLEIMFDDLKKFGRAFNLRYEEIVNEDSEDKKDKPVLGKFTYLGEEPEKLGVRNLRHILDGFARFYFKVRHPSIAPVCNSTEQTSATHPVKKRAVTVDPVPEWITTKCWGVEEDKILEEERLERLSAFAFRMNRKVLDSSDAKAYLEGIEAALNATSISEIHFDDNLRKSPLLTYMESLCENSSLDIRKEGYEINRDLHLEMYELKNHHPEWDGYNMDRIYHNLTGRNTFSVNMTKEAIFNYIVTFSNAFNLRYEELGKRESGADPNKPVFGKFTYLGEEPEKLGVRHLRHILDAFAKFYFKTQDPSSICKGDTSTTPPAPEPTNAKCWNAEQDPVLLEERRERLEAYALWNERREAKMMFTKNYFDALGEALSASNASEIHFDDHLSKVAPILSLMQDLAMNFSLELAKEGLEIARDLSLEIDELEDHTSKWEGYDFKTILNNVTGTNGKSDGSVPTLETMFDDLKTFGRAFNLRYEEIEIEDSEDKKGKPMLGKFTYLGEEPEKLGVRHIRHILDGFARFYFKVRHPSIAQVCNSKAGGGGNTNTG